MAFSTVAVNCWVESIAMVGLEGEMVTTTAARIVIVALADLEMSATEVALTVTVAVLGTLTGAVYRPAPLIMPQEAPLHPVPERLHITPVLVELCTAAVSWTDLLT